MKALYSTTVDAIGGRDGAVRSADGILDLKLAIPTELGGKGGASSRRSPRRRRRRP
jgi:organic hydroperoxide reductase OsmC/OhrA